MFRGLVSLSFSRKIVLGICSLIFLGLFWKYEEVRKAPNLLFGVWQEQSDLDPDCKDVADRLIAVDVNYLGLDAQVHQGRIQVLDSLVRPIKNLFSALLQEKFRFEKVEIPDRRFQLSSETDPFKNRTFGFHCTWSPDKKDQRSSNSYGVGISVNPVQNPYLGIDQVKNEIPVVLPKEGLDHINRLPVRPGKVTRFGVVTSPIASIFAKYGWNDWGGSYREPINYMQFSPRQDTIVLLLAMNREDGEKFFSFHVNYLEKVLPKQENVPYLDLTGKMKEQYAQGVGIQALVDWYQKNSQDFLQKARALAGNKGS